MDKKRRGEPVDEQQHASRTLKRTRKNTYRNNSATAAAAQTQPSHSGASTKARDPSSPPVSSDDNGKCQHPSNDGEALRKDYQDLLQLHSQLRDPSELRNRYSDLVFDVPPHLQPDPLPSNPTPDEIERRCVLDPRVTANSIFIGYEEHLMRARRHVLELRSKYASGRVSDLALVVQADILRFRGAHLERLVQEWRRQYALKDETHVVDTSRYFRNRLISIIPSVLILYLTVASLYLLSNVSQSDCRFALSGCSLALQVQFLSSAVDRDGFKDMLLDVEDIVQHLDLSPRFMSFVCCTRCFFIKLLDTDVARQPNDEACHNRVKGRLCNTPLFKTRMVSDKKRDSDEKVEKKVPIREFLYHSIPELIRHLYRQPHIEPSLQDDPCERPRRSTEYVHDIWEAPALRNFEFTPGQRFTDCPDEDRLVFSLNMDGFNPETNRQAGKVVSVGALYLVCLNLPPEIRYKMENIHVVGVIPGPHLPSKHEINYLLSPMIDDFLILWESGMYVSRTHLRPQGVRVRAAIVPLICDLPAARQMSGFASYSHSMFCSECKLSLNNIDDLDCDEWTPRTWEEHLRQAKSWRDAATEGERKRLYTENGTRWSELLRLPYWDPTSYTLVDSMHAFYLRLLQHHIRNIWGMSIKVNDSGGFTYDPYAQELSEVQMINAHHVARHGSIERLKTLKRHALEYLCQEYGVVVGRHEKRQELLSLLIRYRVEQEWWTEDDRHIPPGEGAPLPLEYLKDGKTTTQDVFWNGNKTRITSLVKEDLVKVFSIHVLPTLQPSMASAQVQKLGNSALKDFIQDKASPGSSETPLPS